MDALFELLVWLLRAAYKAYRKRQLGQDGADEEEPDHSTRAVPRAPQVTRTAVDEASETLRELEALRRDAERPAFLRDVEFVARALYEPLLEFQRRRGIPLSTREVVAVEGESPGDLTRLCAGAPLAPIEVSSRLRLDVLAWPTIAREVGRDILFSLEGFDDGVRTAAQFPQARPVLDPGYLDESHVMGALGSWRVELCADGLGSLLTGPAYLASLVSLHRQPREPYRTRTVPVARGRVQPTPPAELRVQASAAVLEQLGFADEAGALLDDWTDVHGDPMEFLFPIGGGRYAAIPEDMLLQPVRELARALCAHTSPSLAGMHLVDVPDLHFSLARHREATAVAASSMQDHGGDPRPLLAGYALAGYRDPDRRAQLRSMLHFAPARATQRSAPSRPTATAPETLVSPAVLRDAVVLQGVMQRKTI